MHRKIKNQRPHKAAQEMPVSSIETQIKAFIPHALTDATIIKKVKANIKTITMPARETCVGKVVAFNTFIQLIKGSVKLSILNRKQSLQLGDGFIIPQKTKYSLVANQDFQMILTIFNSGSGDTYLNSLS